MNDVGEIRRVLNSVLAFMEEPNATDSLVVAATNHVEILDNALARRFDDVIAYDLPDQAGARDVVQRRLGKFKVPGSIWNSVAGFTEGLSHGELTRAADTVVKNAILEGAKQVSVEALSAALQDRQAFRQRFRPTT